MTPLLDARPDWAGQIALHHGSLDRAVREWVELSLKNGELRAVVCTSSLDLGVDFLPVERVLQVGSPKVWRGCCRAPGAPATHRAVPRAQWCLDFVCQGGTTLSAYPDFRRAVPDDEGAWRLPDIGLARRHRMSVGTIVSDATMQVRYWSRAGSGGASLGSVEEGFIARLAPGDCFLFGGRLLAAAGRVWPVCRAPQDSAQNSV